MEGSLFKPKHSKLISNKVPMDNGLCHGDCFEYHLCLNAYIEDEVKDLLEGMLHCKVIGRKVRGCAMATTWGRYQLLPPFGEVVSGLNFEKDTNL